jgi:hypothetical protein
MRRLLISTVLASVLLVPAAAAQAKPKLGIADNKASTFADPRLQALHVKYARINVPYDVLSDANTLPQVDAWMAGAKAIGAKPLVSFDRSRRHHSANPSPSQLASALKAWRKRWPGQIKEISAWNEPNINGKSASRVAKWWLALRKACSSCTVLPGELVDKSNAITFAKSFVKAAKRSPSIWALHAYVDANNFKTTNTKKFLKAVKGKVWLTETGGVVRRTNGSATFAGKGVAFQTKATDYLLNKLVKVSSRIQRVYFYAWSSVGDKNWDSGLIGPAGARPALNVVRKYLGLAPDPTAVANS